MLQIQKPGMATLQHPYEAVSVENPRDMGISKSRPGSSGILGLYKPT